jgi:hypothetical protein
MPTITISTTAVIINRMAFTLEYATVELAPVASSAVHINETINVERHYLQVIIERSRRGPISLSRWNTLQ